MEKKQTSLPLFPYCVFLSVKLTELTFQILKNFIQRPFMHRYVHAEIYPCAGTFMHRYVHAQVCSSTGTFMHMYVHAQVRTFMHRNVHAFVINLYHVIVLQNRIRYESIGYKKIG